VGDYTVYVPDELNERLRELAFAQRRRPRSQAEVLLMDAIRRAGQDSDRDLGSLAAAFEAEGQRWFAQADRHSTSLTRRLLLQTRGEAWFQAASRVRAAISSQARTADEPPTAA